MTAQPLPSDSVTYLDDLVTHLRLLEVPGERIGQILAETESHPTESFGEPREYARELAAREGMTLPEVSRSDTPIIQLFSTFRARDWVTLAVGILVIGAGTFLGLGGILSLTMGSPLPLGMNPWLAIAIGVVVAIGWWVWVRVVTDPIVDPRTGDVVRWDRRGRRRTDA